VRIRDYFATEIAANRFWARKDCCKVRWKPKYYSRDRNAQITFDVSVEFYLPGAKEFSSILLIECKNYSHAVPVDDIEEFFTKVQQVAAANAKAVLASTAPFQRGTREFAKSKDVGLLRYFSRDNCKWELKRSPSTTARSSFPDALQFIEDGLTQQSFVSPVFDLYMQSSARVTNSLWDFIEDLVLDAGVPPDKIRRLLNPRSKHSSGVPYVEKDALESQAADLLSLVSYSGGELNLDAVCAQEHARTALIVRTGVAGIDEQDTSSMLGRITFDPLVIEIYRQVEPHRGRERFTLAHELAHHFLSHGEHLVREYCDEKDFTLHRRAAVDGTDISRLEFQANFFASCLLMPRQHFLDDFLTVVRRLDITNRGFGALYVDDQPCNVQSLNLVITALEQKYGVSRTAIRIRLETLGLLRERRGPVHVTSALANAELFSGHGPEG
jgi:Zn-dependent peptidase ImmA (M78 family)